MRPGPGERDEVRPDRPGRRAAAGRGHRGCGWRCQAGGRRRPARPATWRARRACVPAGCGRCSVSRRGAIRHDGGRGKRRRAAWPGGWGTRPAAARLSPRAQGVIHGDEAALDVLCGWCAYQLTKESRSRSEMETSVPVQVRLRKHRSELPDCRRSGGGEIHRLMVRSKADVRITAMYGHAASRRFPQRAQPMTQIVFLLDIGSPSWRLRDKVSYAADNALRQKDGGLFT